MMHSFWEFVQHQLATNQFFGGGLILMIGGGLVAYFREVPSTIWVWLRRRWVIEIDILDREPAFEWIDRWLAEHSYSRNRARSLTVKTLSLVLIEDIDCVFVERKATEDKQNKLTFSGLLNALDGVAAGEGRVLFTTTNHIERLDPALIRPGRIDRKEWIGNADRSQLRRLFVRFFGDEDPTMADYFADSLPADTVPMSAVQTHLVRYADSADDALLSLDDLAEQRVENVKESAWDFEVRI
jgi:hypothetical protein